MTTSTARVWVTVPSGDVLLRAEATLIGRPVRAKGKPVKIEVELDSGRTTLAHFETAEPANEEAKALLEYVPPETGVPAA